MGGGVVIYIKDSNGWHMKTEGQICRKTEGKWVEVEKIIERVLF